MWRQSEWDAGLGLTPPGLVALLAAMLAPKVGPTLTTSAATVLSPYTVP